jgi:hypothetical protein
MGSSLWSVERQLSTMHGTKAAVPLSAEPGWQLRAHPGRSWATCLGQKADLRSGRLFPAPAVLRRFA